MALVEYVDPEDAEGDLAERFDAERDRYGQVSLFARAMANAPGTYLARSQYTERLLAGSGIDDSLAELAYVAVSVANDCDYCTASHAESLAQNHDVPHERVQAIADGDLEGFDERERAVLEFARSVATDPKRVAEDDLDALRAVGFDDAGIVELTTVCSAAVAANTFADALNVLPQDRGDGMEDLLPE